MNAAKVELGRHLFYDKRMSMNGKESCASCHRQEELAFTDGRAHVPGTTGQLLPRSSMSLVNVAYIPFLTWANPSLTTVEEQALIPMLAEDPIELGLKGHEQEFLSALRRESVYQRLFPQAFPGEADAYTLGNVTKAIAAFERTIISMRPLMTATAGEGIPRLSRPRQSAGRSCFPPANAEDAFSVTADGISAGASGSREAGFRAARAIHLLASLIPV
jgi:cytochrome c peroxidase